jgi:ADP-ribosyl-[dinitrogen reductase] hydrolase
MRDHFRWIAGESQIRAHEFSPGKLRRFCSECGTHLIAERPAQPHIILRVATLDDNPDMTPSVHIWTSHDVPWLADDDGMPRYPEWPPAR